VVNFEKAVEPLRLPDDADAAILLKEGIMANYPRGTLRVVFVVALAVLVARVGAAQTYETIYSFKGSPEASDPMGGLVIGTNGALFGTTFAGGTSGQGTVYELTYAKGTGWKETVLYSFTGSSDGGNPESTLAFGSTGALYGTARSGGGGEGAIFEMAPPTTTGGAWIETVLYGFGYAPHSQNVVPNGPVLIDKSGTLYTTTQGSPDTNGGPPLGLVLALVPPATSGSAWTEYELYIFGGNGGGASGEVPTAGVVSEAGSLFGTTEYAGNGYGTVYELTPPATNGPAWTETTIHPFAAQPGDGGGPLAPLTLGSGGVLYGTTSYGGSGSCPKHLGADDGCGTVFQLTPPATPGGAWTESVIYSFTGVNGDGAYPAASVAIGKNGALYGTTEYGGIATSPCPVSSYDFPGGCGTVFKLTPPSAPGGTWTETVLHDFTEANGDGASPVAPLVLSSNGVFYGTTSGGGTAGKGTIFAVAP
jgi:uncharacterized repeat protein (TIGR03803 family)